jgi:hypothetical protein
MSKEGSRAERLYYTGDGTYFFGFAPAKDLDAEELAALDDDQYAALLSDQPPDGKPLYQVSRPAGRHAPTTKAADEPPPAADDEAGEPPKRGQGGRVSP